MAVITFCSNETKPTGQTTSLATIATHMSIEHNYKILLVSTAFDDLSLENCFWEYEKIRQNAVIDTGDKNKSVGLASGIEGLITVLNSNRISSEIIKDYSRTILKERLDILMSPITKSFNEYTNIAEYYTTILQNANKYYDIVFVDLNRQMPSKDKVAILQMSDVVVLNLSQKLKAINDFIKLKEKDEFYKRKNVMLTISRYDKFSKYNNKNITRYLKERKLISAVPYNTLLFEACSEGTIIDFIVKMRSVSDETDNNFIFLKEVKEASNDIIFKLQELQMKI